MYTSIPFLHNPHIPFTANHRLSLLPVLFVPPGDVTPTASGSALHQIAASRFCLRKTGSVQGNGVRGDGKQEEMVADTSCKAGGVIKIEGKNGQPLRPLGSADWVPFWLLGAGRLFAPRLWGGVRASATTEYYHHTLQIKLQGSSHYPHY